MLAPGYKRTPSPAQCAFFCRNTTDSRQSPEFRLWTTLRLAQCDVSLVAIDAL